LGLFSFFENLTTFGIGYCFDSSAGFTLPDGSVRNPDAAWIEKLRWEKVPLEDKKRFAHICPDFVI
jgi:Uma2 family endonuclease